jgi:hypothetical protein
MKKLLFMSCMWVFVSSVCSVEVELSTEVDTRVAANLSENTDTFQSTYFSIEQQSSLYFENGWTLNGLFRVMSEESAKTSPGRIGRGFYQPSSRPLLVGDATEIELRELYLEIPLSDHLLTLGKQQIVWGKSDGLKLLDVVNPQSFREFVLEDFEDSRIPLWMANVELALSVDTTLQLLWIPDTTVHSLVWPEGTYRISTPRIVPVAPEGVAVSVDEFDRPSNPWEDGDLGVRFVSFWKGWDLSLNYLYRYDDFPVFRQVLSIEDASPLVTVSPEYERSQLLGASASNSYGDATIRLEIAYDSDKYFLTRNTSDPDGVVSHEELSSVVGLDWSGVSDTLISVQWFQSLIFDPSEYLTRPDIDHTGTLLLRRDFLNETLRTEILVVHNFNDADGMIRPKVTYGWNDATEMWFGIDYFYGEKKGLFGQFDSNDRLNLGITINI